MSYRTVPTQHATFSDSTTHTITTVTSAYALRLNTEDDKGGIEHDIVGRDCSISIANPAVITLANHGYYVGSVVQFTTDGALPTGITAGTRYFVIAAGFTTGEFQIATDPIGAAVITTGSQSGTHKVYSSAQMKFRNAGQYLFAISLICDTTNATAALLDVWFRRNGVNEPNSNTQVGINNANITQVLAVTFVLNLAANDVIEIMFHGSTTATRILAIAAQSGPPVIPACPSIIVAIAKVGL